MPVFDTFTKRMKRQERGVKPDVYQYDTLPEHFRIQVIRILIRALGRFSRRRRLGGKGRFTLKCAMGIDS